MRLNDVHVLDTGMLSLVLACTHTHTHTHTHSYQWLTLPEKWQWTGAIQTEGHVIPRSLYSLSPSFFAFGCVQELCLTL
jgi:hypothetical protein